MRLASTLSVLAVVAACSHGASVRPFPDRPVAWSERDEAHFDKKLKRRVYWKEVYVLRNDIFRKADHYLAVGVDPTPAEDVNAIDEVPCSTWYCPRNHLRAMTPEQVAAGPSFGRPPVKPFRAVKPKTEGTTPGFIIEDATGTKYILKFDPKAWFNLSSGAEAVGTRLAHAAGWHVPATFNVDVGDDEIIRDEKVDAKEFDWILSWGARTPDGKLRASASQYLEGDILGPFEYTGRRPDDPNDRIRHEQRRSLRASWLLMAWLNNADGTTQNALDVKVTEDGRSFIRHYLTDFATCFGSWTVTPKAPNLGKENRYAFSRMIRSMVAFGAWERPWQNDRDEFLAEMRRHPSVGPFEAEGWDPATFRTQAWVVAHKRMTPRDAYWGAKVITAFTDEQIHAAVQAGRYPAREAAYIERGLRIRRDKIGERYLARYAAIEEAVVEGGHICFLDLAQARGYVHAGRTYRWRMTDRRGERMAEGRFKPAAARACVTPGLRGDYVVLSIWREHPGLPNSKASHIHASYRPEERRWVIVGLDRDE